jgi:hypothetical protein
MFNYFCHFLSNEDALNVIQNGLLLSGKDSELWTRDQDYKNE